MKNIIPKKEDNYIVVTNSIITSFDRKVLTRLYQPIIGSIAFSLYLTLLSELEFDNTISKENRPHNSLLKLSKITLDDLVLATGKLEGVGLIKTKYSKKNNLFSYNLFAPLTPADFFDSPLLDNQYRNAIDVEEYQKSRLYFKQSNVNNEDFEDISMVFNDVYELNINNKFEGKQNEISNNRAKLKIKFDYDVFFEKLNEFQVSKKIITEEIKELVAIISISHNISAVDMASLVHRSLDRNGKISTSKLKELCQHNVFTASITIQPFDSGNDKLNSLIDTYNSKDPFEFLLYKNNYTTVSDSDRRIVSSLINDYKLQSSVINALIDYCLEKNGNILSKNYVEKVASTLVRSNIDDAMSAIRFLNSSKKTSTNKFNFDNSDETDVIIAQQDKSEEELDEEIAETLRKIEELNKGRD